MIYKGLSVNLEGKFFFGIVRNTDELLVDKYRIKNFPTIAILRPSRNFKPEFYKGDLKYNPIFEWLNIYSETFVPGGGTKDTSATKSWLSDLVPELH